MTLRSLEVRTGSRAEAPGVARAIEDSLGYPYRTEDWQAQNSGISHALKLEKLGMTFIRLLIVLVAAFSIVSTLTMVVADKTREIGILRAMGMTARSIRRGRRRGCSRWRRFGTTEAAAFAEIERFGRPARTPRVNVTGPVPVYFSFRAMR